MENKLSASAALPPSSLSSSLHFSENSMSESSPPFSKPTQSTSVTAKGKNDLSINNNTANKKDANVSTSDHNDKMMDAELFTHVRSGVLRVLDQHESTNKQNVSSPERHLEQLPARLAREAASPQQAINATTITARDRLPMMPLANANNNKENSKKQELVEDTGEFCNNESIAFDVLTENSIDFECHTPESVKHNSTNVTRENDMHFAIPYKRDNDNSDNNSSFLRERESSETIPKNFSFKNQYNNKRYMIPKIISKSGVRTVYSSKGPPIPLELFEQMQHRDYVNKMGNVIPLKHIQTKEHNEESVFGALHDNSLQANYYGFQQHERRGNTSLIDNDPDYRRQLENANLYDERLTPQQRLKLQREKEKLWIWKEEQNKKKRLHEEKILEQQRKRNLLLQQAKERQKEEEKEEEEQHEENNPSLQTNGTLSENNSTSHSKKSLSTKFNKLLGKIHCAPVGRSSAQDYERYLNNSIATDSHRSSISVAQPESHHASVHSLSLSSGQANQIRTEQTNNATSASVNGAYSNTAARNMSNNQESTSSTTMNKKKRTIAGEIVHYFHKRSQKKKDKKAEKLRRKEMERVSQQNSTGLAAASVSTTTNNVNSNNIVANSTFNAATTSTSAAVDQVKKSEQFIPETLHNKSEAIEIEEEQEKHNPQMEEEIASATGKLAVYTNTDNVAEKAQVSSKEEIDSAIITEATNHKQLELEAEKQPLAKETQEHLISTSEQEKVKETSAENIIAKANNINANVEQKQNTTLTLHAHVLSTHEQRQSQPTMTLKLDESKTANINDDLDDDDDDDDANNNNKFCYEDEDNINNHSANKQDMNKGNIANKDDTQLSSVESIMKKAEGNTDNNDHFNIGDSIKSKATDHHEEKNETTTNAHISHSSETINVLTQKANSQQEKEESEQSEYNEEEEEEEEEEEYYEELKTEEEKEPHSHVHFDTANEMIKERTKKGHTLQSDNTNDKHVVHESNVDSKHDVSELNKYNDAENKERRTDTKFSNNSNEKNEHHTSEIKGAVNNRKKEWHKEKESGNTAVNVMVHDHNKSSRHSLSSESTSSHTSNASITEEENKQKIEVHKERIEGNENEKTHSSTEMESQTSVHNAQTNTSKINDMTRNVERQQEEKELHFRSSNCNRQNKTSPKMNTHFLKVGQKVEETLQKDKRYRILQKHEQSLLDELAQLDSKLQQVPMSASWLGEYYRKMSATEHRSNSQANQNANKVDDNYKENKKSVHSNKNGSIHKKSIHLVNSKKQEEELKQDLWNVNKSLSFCDTNSKNNRKCTRAASIGELSWSDTSLLQRMQRQERNKRTKRLTWEENTYYTKQRIDNKHSKENLLVSKNDLICEEDHTNYNLNGSVMSADHTPLQQSSIHKKQNGARLTMESIHHLMHKLYYCKNSNLEKVSKERRRSWTSELLSALTQQATEQSTTPTHNLQFIAHTSKNDSVTPRVSESVREQDKDIVNISSSSLLSNINEYKIRPSCAACVPQSVTELTALAAYMTLTERLKEEEEEAETTDNDDKYERLIQSMLEMEQQLLEPTAATSTSSEKKKTSLVAHATKSNTSLVHPAIQLTQHIREEFYEPRPTQKVKQMHKNREEELRELLPSATQHENEHEEELESKHASASRSLSSSTWSASSSSVIARELRMKAIQMLEQLVEENNSSNAPHATLQTDKHIEMNLKETFGNNIDNNKNKNVCNVNDDLEYNSEDKLEHNPIFAEDVNNAVNILDELFSSVNSEINNNNINSSSKNNTDTNCDVYECVKEKIEETNVYEEKEEGDN